MANRKKRASKPADLMGLMGFRIPDEERKEIEAAAAIEKRTPSAFVRIAAVAAARAVNAAKR